MSCVTYSIVPTDCPCLLTLASPGGQTIALNLDGATVRENPTGTIHIQTRNGGAIAAADSSFTAADIEDLICSCSGGGGGCYAPVEIQAYRVILDGVDSFTLPANCTSMAYTVIAVGDVGDPPTLTDATGATDLFLNESASFSIKHTCHSNLATPLDITTKAGDTIVVTYEVEI